MNDGPSDDGPAPIGRPRSDDGPAPSDQARSDDGPAPSDQARSHPAGVDLAGVLGDPGTQVGVLRRRPKFVAFIGVGVIAGVLAAGIWTVTSQGDGSYGIGAVLGYTSIVLGFLGGIAGAGVAAALDRSGK